MSASGIQAKIKKGLAKAISKTGSTSSELIYVEKITLSGGNSPLNPPIQTPNNVPLIDAVFKSYNQELIDGVIQAGDRQLVANGDVVIKRGEIIIEGNTRYTVESVDVKAPTSDVLAYIAQVRVQ